MTESEPSPAGGESETHRGGKTDRLVLPAAAHQAELAGEGSAAGRTGRRTSRDTHLPAATDPTPSERPFKKPACTWLVFSACD